MPQQGTDRQHPSQCAHSFIKDFRPGSGRTDPDSEYPRTCRWCGTVEVEGPLPWGQYRTKTGKVLTAADIALLAEEAEKGYDVSHLPHGWYTMGAGLGTDARRRRWVSRIIREQGLLGSMVEVVLDNETLLAGYCDEHQPGGFTVGGFRLPLDRVLRLRIAHDVPSKFA